MTKSKLWHNKTEIKNVKVAKMVELIKSCDKYPHKFNFGQFFSFLILPPFCWGKNRFQSTISEKVRVHACCAPKAAIRYTKKCVPKINSDVCFTKI